MRWQMTACEGPVMPTVRPCAMSSRICSAAVYVLPVPGGPCMGRYERRSEAASRTAAAPAVSPAARAQRSRARSRHRAGAAAAARSPRPRRQLLRAPPGHRDPAAGPAAPRSWAARPRPGPRATARSRCCPSSGRSSRAHRPRRRPSTACPCPDHRPCRPRRTCVPAAGSEPPHHRLLDLADHLPADQAAQRVRLPGQFRRAQRAEVEVPPPGRLVLPPVPVEQVSQQDPRLLLGRASPRKRRPAAPT